MRRLILRRQLCCLPPLSSPVLRHIFVAFVMWNTAIRVEHLLPNGAQLRKSSDGHHGRASHSFDLKFAPPVPSAARVSIAMLRHTR
jgi:hypothetical protein